MTVGDKQGDPVAAPTGAEKRGEFELLAVVDDALLQLARNAFHHPIAVFHGLRTSLSRSNEAVSKI